MRTLNRRRRFLVGALFVAVIGALAVGQAMLERVAMAQSRAGVQAPMFEVDPMWPKPLPNHWVLGSTIGVSADAQDNIWIIHRGSSTLANNEKGLEMKPPAGLCCAAAPPILQFNPAGDLIGHWGGPGAGYEWPDSNHGITIDHKGNVWIGGNGGPDAHVLKFTKDGKFLMQAGKKGARSAPGSAPTGTSGGGGGAPQQPAFAGNSNDPNSFGRVAKIFVDPKANEAYLADGYLNKRVAVIDADTGKMKRFWGAYGSKPDDANTGSYDPNAPPAKQFRSPVHCAELSNDGLLYVCDRPNDRIQVFKADGTFVKEIFVEKQTRGSVWDIAFSRDPQQRFLYLADAVNSRIHIIQRDTLQVLTSFGDGGRQPGQFYGAHSIATDSKGNIYITETYEGKRVQKFVFKGMGPVTREHQGTVWPRSSN